LQFGQKNQHKVGANEGMASEEMGTTKKCEVLCIGTIEKCLKIILGIDQTAPISG
jgi:hypothetical protein